MSTIRTLTMIAALAAGSVACHKKPAEKAASADTGSGADKAAGTEAPGSADKPAAVKEMVPDADAQRFYAFIEQLAVVVVANEDDCVKLAAAINAHIEANKALVADAAGMMKQHKVMPPEIKEKMDKKFKDELGPAVTKKCGKDQSVMDAFRNLAAK